MQNIIYFLNLDGCEDRQLDFFSNANPLNITFYIYKQL